MSIMVIELQSKGLSRVSARRGNILVYISTVFVPEKRREASALGQDGPELDEVGDGVAHLVHGRHRQLRDRREGRPRLPPRRHRILGDDVLVIPGVHPCVVVQRLPAHLLKPLQLVGLVGAHGHDDRLVEELLVEVDGEREVGGVGDGFHHDALADLGVPSDDGGHVGEEEGLPELRGEVDAGEEGVDDEHPILIFHN